MQQILDRVSARFDLDAIAAGIAGFVPDLIAALFTFLVYYSLWRLAALIVRKVGGRRKSDPTAVAFVQSGLKAVLLVLGLVSALAQLGVDTASLLASLGVVGLTIGFAARDALSNIISGVLIFWDRPFVLGDLVEVDGHYGRVDKITFRSTRVVTPDGRMLAVPNTNVINTTVASYTNFPHLRLEVEVTVGVSEDLGRVRALFLEIVAADDAYETAPPPTMVVAALGDYNVTVKLQAWLRDEQQHLAKTAQLRELVYERFRAAEVDMPFETIQLQPVHLLPTPASAAQ
ncbi:MAG: mechanosensitive ion channel protein MscS [Deltaproteobacteria bacterium HGW-Deltaproteobacteria-14]|jgi:small conductance mechanosensitive channel|nr:MAG: mechanosensitive ion channel protein MscS [Deltaproteobacteria bacterium HGW-Deltaproteobacteria-14]